MADENPNGVQVDADAVIRHLKNQLGEASVQLATMAAYVENLQKENERLRQSAPAS